MSEDGGATTLDAFHRGDFHVVQPARGSHRAGMDAMMLAAAVPGGFAGSLADLGAGAGAAGLAVASRCPASRVVLVERSPEMAACARESIAHPQNSRIAGRAQVVEMDVTLTGKARVLAGLADSAFDFAIMNPPFNEGRDRPTPAALKRDAHVMEPDLFERWIRTAAAIVKPRGGLALIARPQSLQAILAALSGRFGGNRIVPVLPRATEPAIRIIVRGTRGSRAGMTIEPALVLHGETGHGHAPRADKVCNGRESLFGD
jgi:tRNA1(Val) A37 N6-methylase TrmN6